MPHPGVSWPRSYVPYSYHFQLGAFTVSIIKTRELLEKRGCGSCIGIAIGIVFLLGIVFTGQRGGCAANMGPNGQAAEKFAIAQVAGFNIELGAFDALVKRTSTMFFGDEAALASQPIDLRVNLYASILDEMIQKARIVGEGEKMGINISDSQLASYIDADLEKAVEMQYSFYVKQMPKGKAMSYDQFKKSPEAEAIKARYRPMVAPFESGDSVYFSKAVYVEREMRKKLAGGKDPDKLKPEEVAKITAEMQQKMKQAERDFPIKWNDPAFKLLYQYKVAKKDFKTLQPLIEEANALVKDVTKVQDSGLIKQVRYALLEEAWQVATPEQKKEILEQRISAIEDVLLTTEDFALRMNLVDLYREANQTDKVIEHLLAASGNNIKYDEAGKQHYEAVNKKLKELLDAKVIDEAMAKAVRESQKNWVEGKAEQEKMEQEAKRIEAERAKERAEEAKRFEEEKRKYEQEQAKKKAQAGAEKKPAAK